MARRICALLLFALLAFSLPAGAAEWIAGDSTGLPAGRVVDDDLYVAGGNVLVQGDVRGDLIVAGGEILLEGTVGGDVLVAGGDVRITGPVLGSIRAATGRLRIEGPVGEDLVASAGELTVAGGSRVGRDLLASAGQVELLGPVARRAWIAAGSARVAADVGGDLEARVGSLTVEDVRIGGNLVFPESANTEISGGSEVHGKIVRTEQPDEGRGVLGVIWFVVRLLVGLWALGALFTLAAPLWSERAAARVLDRPGIAVIAGLAVLLGAPVLAALIFVLGLLVGGWWIGLFVLALYVIALFLAVAVAGRAVGSWIAGRRRGEPWPWPLVLLVGLAVLVVLFAIPFLGAAIGVVAVLFGLGGLWLARFHGERPARPPV